MFSKYSAAFVLRAQNIRLLRKSAGLLSGLGIPVIPFFGTKADLYLKKILHATKFDYLINIDEDAFLTSPGTLFELFEEFVAGGYALAGVADGGVTQLRTFNPYVINPFFTLMHAARLRALTYRELAHTRCVAFDFAAHMKANPPTWVKPDVPWRLSFTEPYYPFFYGAHALALPVLWLDARPWDGAGGRGGNPENGLPPDVVYDTRGRPFLIHTWFARAYGRDKAFTRVIDAAHREALSLNPEKRPAAAFPLHCRRFAAQTFCWLKQSGLFVKHLVRLVKYLFLMPLAALRDVIGR